MNRYFKSFVLIASVAAMLNVTGCANVATQDKSADEYAKEFKAPPNGWAGLYLYRTCNIFGAGLKKSLYVDGHYLGETSRCRFFYRLVRPGVHRIDTESEFSENFFTYDFKEGINTFINQYIRLGVFVGGANIEVKDPEFAKAALKDYSLAENKDNPALNLRNASHEPNAGSIPGPVSDEEYRKLEEKESKK